MPNSPATNTATTTQAPPPPPDDETVLPNGYPTCTLCHSASMIPIGRFHSFDTWICVNPECRFQISREDKPQRIHFYATSPKEKKEVKNIEEI